jgi:hypothetical protein
MSDKLIKCLLIKTNNLVEEITIKNEQIPEILKTKYVDHESLDYLDNKGYRCGIICKDMSTDDDKINIIASTLCKKSQLNGNFIKGNVILMDNNDITKKDLSKILDIANNFDYAKWRKEENERILKLMEEDFKEIRKMNV